MTQKRILYVIHRFWPYPGGAERLFWEWAKSSRDDGYDVTVFTTDAWDIEYFHDRSKRRIASNRETADGISIRRFGIFSLPPKLHWTVTGLLSYLPSRYCDYVFGYPHILLPGYLREMAFTRERYDLVNTGVFPHLFLTYPAVRYAERMSVPVVCTPLAHLGEPHSSPERQALPEKQVSLLKRCQRVVTMTEIERQAIMGQGVSEDRVRVVGAGVDPEEVAGGRGDRFRERYGITGRMILQISTQTHDKGSLHTIEAMKHLWGRGADVTLVLIGQVMNDFDEYFRQQPPRVYERTVVLDYVDEQTKKDAIDACDVFVMPSRAESFGIVYLEAWLYRKPVIGVSAGGVPDLVTDGRDGFLVPFADIHMLAEYIRLLLDTPALADAFGTNGYNKVLRHHTWKQSCERLRKVYRDVLR